jgi:hypothetical protein
MVLTAENGWTAGEWGYGPDKKTALQEALNEHLIAEGKEPIDWSQEDAQPVRDRGAESPDDRQDNSLRAGTASSSRQDRSGPRLRRI